MLFHKGSLLEQIQEAPKAILENRKAVSYKPSQI